MTRRQYRIFISSPSDVRPERAIAERVVARLARDFAHHCEISAVLWEHEPLLATQHFQDFGNIPPPSTTDICVVVLWSVLGIKLPGEKFRGAISGRCVTGTEWEFEDALKGHRERGTPDLIFYRKTAEIVASLSDEAALDEMRQQKRAVDDFMARWFKTADGAGFTAASHEFATTADFETRLEEHLRVLLQRRLARDLGLAADAGGITWTGAPWPALAAFDLAQSPIFFGRSRARTELRALLAARAQAGIGFILVVGASGSGKSSLVRAGLLADLMLPGMVGAVGLARYGIMRPADAGADMLLALARAMLSATALPELAGLDYEPDTLAALLRHNPGQASFAVRQGLGKAAEGRLTRRGEARLVLIIDQLEEIFTIEDISRQDREVFVSALAALARSGLVWVIGTLRADFFGRLEQVPALAELAEGGIHLLLPPNLAELAEIVGKPARAAGLRFEVDDATGTGLDSAIVSAAARDPGALPLLSFALDALWRQPREGAELGFDAYAKLGGLEGAIAHHAEAVVSALPEAARAALPGLLLGLVSIRAGEVQATSRASQRRDLAQGPLADLVIDRLIAARLLIADETGQGTSLRLAHEALLASWPRLAGLIEESRERLAAMTRLRADLAEWEHNGQPADLLLPAGKRLSEGLDLLEHRRAELGDALAGFIQASADLAFAARRQRRRLVAGAFAVLLVLTSAAGLGAWFGLSGRFAAEASRNAFQRQFEIAEKSRAQILALALKTERDPGVLEAVALSILPRHQSGEQRSALLDRLTVSANSQRQRMVLSGHGNKALFATFSPDGTRIVTASLDKTVRVWSASTGALLNTLSGHGDQVESAAYSPDGTRIVSGSDDRTARLWDAASGKMLRVLAGHAGTIYGVAFSPDGKRVVTASDDKTARVWDAASGALIATLIGHEAAVSTACFSPDGKRIVTASTDKTARLWDAESFRPLKTLSGHESYVETAVFSPDGTRILTASFDKTARIWDAASGVVLQSFPVRSVVSFAAFSPDGRRIATAAANKTAQIWDAASGALLETLIGHRDVVASAGFSPDGQRLVTASIDTTARVWDVGSNAQILSLGLHSDEIRNVAFSPDGHRVVTTSMDGTARVWDAANGVPLAHLTGHESGILGADVSPDGRRVVTASMDTTVRVWDLQTGAPVKVFTRAGVQMEDANFSPDGRFIVTASNDNLARLIDPETGAAIITFSGHAGWVRTARFSPDQRRIVTASLDKTARIWDAATGGALRTLSGHAANVTDARFSPDGRRIVTASTDGTARVWDAGTGALLDILVGHEAGVRSAAFSPDGRYIVTGSGDGSARIWDAPTGALLMSLIADGAAVADAAFSPDGKRLITASADRLGRIWDVPDYILPAEISFIRATSSRGLEAALRTQYGLGVAPAPAPRVTAPGCDPVVGPAGAPADWQNRLADWKRGAQAGDGDCHQRLAEFYESGRDGVPDLARAFFFHALAARLLEEQGVADAAQDERYRREALAWTLPRLVAGALMDAAEAWRPGQDFPAFGREAQAAAHGLLAGDPRPD